MDRGVGVRSCMVDHFWKVGRWMGEWVGGWMDRWMSGWTDSE